MRFVFKLSYYTLFYHKRTKATSGKKEIIEIRTAMRYSLIHYKINCLRFNVESNLRVELLLMVNSVIVWKVFHLPLFFRRWLTSRRNYLKYAARRILKTLARLTIWRR